MSDCSEVRIWSSWTGVRVFWMRIVSPSPSLGALGVPGWMSTKKLPSRKMRGRIAAVASVWMGRPLSWISMLTTAPWLTPLPNGSTSVTLPTLTPAMRTGEFLLMLLADLKAALIVKWCSNGIALVNPK